MRQGRAWRLQNLVNNAVLFHDGCPLFRELLSSEFLTAAISYSFTSNAPTVDRPNVGDLQSRNPRAKRVFLCISVFRGTFLQGIKMSVTASFLEVFSRSQDPREARGMRHPFANIVFLQRQTVIHCAGQALFTTVNHL